MSEFDEIQRLIRLKRHEHPPEGFVDDFIRSLHQRHRAELLQRSARSLLWERVSTYFSEMLNPKWAWAGASVAAVALLGLALRPHEGTGLQVAQAGQDGFEVKGFAATDPDAFKADVESYLKAIEFEPNGGSGPQLIQKPRVVPVRNGQVIPAGLTGPTTFIVQP